MMEKFIVWFIARYSQIIYDVSEEENKIEVDFRFRRNFIIHLVMKLIIKIKGEIVMKEAFDSLNEVIKVSEKEIKNGQVSVQVTETELNFKVIFKYCKLYGKITIQCIDEVTGEVIYEEIKENLEMGTYKISAPKVRGYKVVD